MTTETKLIRLIRPLADWLAKAAAANHRSQAGELAAIIEAEKQRRELHSETACGCTCTSEPEAPKTTA